MKVNKKNGSIGKWVAVFVILAIVTGQYAQAKQIRPGFGLTQPDVIELAKKNPEKLFRRSAEHFDATIRNYKGTLYRQERIWGKLGKEQVIDFKFKDDPHSIFMTWIHNAARIDRLLYVEGQNDDKMLVRQDGLFSIFGTVRCDPHSKDVVKSSLKPCTEFGFLKVLQALVHETERGPGKAKVTTKFIRTFKKYGRNVIEFEQLIDNSHAGKASRRTMLYDIELMIPTSRVAYDMNGDLLYRYVYRDLKFNTGLRDENFTPKATGMQ